jgi:hypothetical protein
LQDYYDVTLWIASEDGIPTVDDLEGYDVIIIDSGDYAYDDSDFDTYSAIFSVS